MTTIAWDGKTLASDSLSTFNGVRSGELKKLFRLTDGRIVGCAGDMDFMVPFIDWLEGKRETLPDGYQMGSIVVMPDGSARHYEEKGNYTPADAPYAIGSGFLAALASMKCGKNAQEAVAIAAELDIYTGGKICIEELA